MHRGEVNGTCGMFASSVKAQFMDDVRSGRLKLVIQMGSKKSDEFGNIPSVFDYAKTDDDRAVLDVHFKQLLLGRPFAGPPGIPADRLKALREALVATMKEPEFLAEASRTGLDIDPASPEEVVDLLKRFAAYPAGSVPQGAGGDRTLSAASPHSRWSVAVAEMTLRCGLLTLSERHVADDGGAFHAPTLRIIVVGGVVLGRSVVPEHDRCPASSARRN